MNTSNKKSAYKRKEKQIDLNCFVNKSRNSNEQTPKQFKCGDNSNNNGFVINSEKATPYRYPNIDTSAINITTNNNNNNNNYIPKTTPSTLSHVHIITSHNSESELHSKTPSLKQSTSFDITNTHNNNNNNTNSNNNIIQPSNTNNNIKPSLRSKEDKLSQINSFIGSIKNKTNTLFVYKSTGFDKKHKHRHKITYDNLTKTEKEVLTRFINDKAVIYSKVCDKNGKEHEIELKQFNMKNITNMFASLLNEIEAAKKEQDELNAQMKLAEGELGESNKMLDELIEKSDVLKLGSSEEYAQVSQSNTVLKNENDKLRNAIKQIESEKDVILNRYYGDVVMIEKLVNCAK